MVGDSSPPRRRFMPRTKLYATQTPVSLRPSRLPRSPLCVSLFGLGPVARGWPVALLRRELRRVMTVALPRADLGRKKMGAPLI